MALTGDSKQLDNVRRAMLDLGTPLGRTQTDVARSVIREVRGVLRDQFAKGEGPSKTWIQTARGKPALISKKLPQDFVGKPVPSGVEFTSRIPWLIAHHEGYVFGSRNVGASKQFLTFDKNGKLIKRKRALNKKGEARRGVFQTYAKAHTVGGRVLPARPIYPEGYMPPRWLSRLTRGVSAAIDRWYQRASGE